MFILDALGRFYEFVQAQLLGGMLTQDNIEASIYNFFLVLLRVLGFLGL